MGVGSAFTSGYSTGAQAKRGRSFMPMINSLSSIISNRKRGQGVRVAGSRGNDTETRSQQRTRRAREDELLLEEKSRYQDEQYRLSQEDQRRAQLAESEEGRRQEAHEAQMASGAQVREQQGEAFQRKTKADDRTQAYEQVKQGLMMKDSRMIQEAFLALSPGGGQDQDVITEGVTEGGARSFKGRPDTSKIPQFIFDPESEAVGVIFPGQKKPTVFENQQEVFQNVLAPMNPKHEKGRDQVAEGKSIRDVEFKDRKLTADIHKDADASAMKQFEADGYFQPELWNAPGAQDRYDNAYNDYVAKATGKTTKPQNVSFTATDKAPTPPPQARKKQPASKDVYRGKAAPKGYPGAKRAKNGAWYFKKDGKWHPITGKADKPKQKKKAPGPVPTKPNRHPMTTAGVNFVDDPATLRSKIYNQEKPTVVRKKIYNQEKPTVVRKKINPGGSK